MGVSCPLLPSVLPVFIYLFLVVKRGFNLFDLRITALFLEWMEAEVCLLILYFT